LSCFAGKKRNPGLKIPKEAFEQPQTSSTPPRDLDSKACISIGEEVRERNLWHQRASWADNLYIQKYKIFISIHNFI
uniref:Uncharacterized protein n=1 Tax=Zonotrichia albicollis TaxID=44394 RepID=A0A8D2QA47_ZONAL